MSLCKNEGISWGEAYQRERQSRFTPSRKPIGLTFCPMTYLSACSSPLSDFGFSLGVGFSFFAALARAVFFAVEEPFFFAPFSRFLISISSVRTIRIWLLRRRIVLPLPRARV